jgi:hypothetical protein
MGCTACTEPRCLWKGALYRTACTEPQCLYKGALYCTACTEPECLYNGALYRTACTEPQCLYKGALYRTACTEPRCLWKGALCLFYLFDSLNCIEPLRFLVLIGIRPLKTRPRYVETSDANTEWRGATFHKSRHCEYCLVWVQVTDTVHFLRQPHLHKHWQTHSQIKWTITEQVKIEVGCIADRGVTAFRSNFSKGHPVVLNIILKWNRIYTSSTQLFYASLI